MVFLCVAFLNIERFMKKTKPIVLHSSLRKNQYSPKQLLDLVGLCWTLLDPLICLNANHHGQPSLALKYANEQRSDVSVKIENLQSNHHKHPMVQMFTNRSLKTCSYCYAIPLLPGLPFLLPNRAKWTVKHGLVTQLVIKQTHFLLACLPLSYATIQ